MAPHSSTLAWKIPRTEEPGGLQSMGSLRVGGTSLSLFTFMHWRRKWQFTPVFLPGKSHGQRSLVGYSPWGHKELDTTETTEHACIERVAQMVMNLSTMQETWVQSLGWEDPLEKGMATHSSILAWRISWTEEPGGL